MNINGSTYVTKLEEAPEGGRLFLVRGVSCDGEHFRLWTVDTGKKTAREVYERCKADLDDAFVASVEVDEEVVEAAPEELYAEAEPDEYEDEV